jgi:hypothetical protein
MNLYVLQIPRKDVESRDIGMVTHHIRQFERIKAPAGCVEIVFAGYDDVPEEVFEIREIREWTSRLLREAPEILYYASWELGTVTRLLACAYDMETVTDRRMNAHEAEEYIRRHGVPHRQPVWISIPKPERERLYETIRRYGIRRKDPAGANRLIRNLTAIFG